MRSSSVLHHASCSRLVVVTLLTDRERHHVRFLPMFRVGLTRGQTSGRDRYGHGRIDPDTPMSLFRYSIFSDTERGSAAPVTLDIPFVASRRVFLRHGKYVATDIDTAGSTSAQVCNLLECLRSR